MDMLGKQTGVLLAFLLVACSSGGDDLPSGGQEPAPEPEEPQVEHTLCTDRPSSQAVKVYEYLWQLQGQKVLSGTMANVNWNTNEAEWVFRQTGKYPALACFDYLHLYASPANWIDYTQTKVVEDWWKQRGLVAACWHWNVPKQQGSTEYGFNAAGTGLAAETEFDIEQALKSGTYENGVVRADLEKVADCLALLKEKGIPVLWRPLHEASGGWFWWGAKGPAAYKQLWGLMFDTFRAKGLDHLIWVWTSEGNDADWYPGDAYVDIVGRDLYNQQDGTKAADEYRRLATAYPDKLVTLSECGGVATIAAQWDKGARWSWFMPWYDYERTHDVLSEAFGDAAHTHADKVWWTTAVNCPQVVTRDQLPSMN